MTDGCGFANYAVLKSLSQKFQWETFPTAIQMRIGGAKVSWIPFSYVPLAHQPPQGLLCLNPDGWRDISEPNIQIRPSQLKILEDPSKPKDPAKLIVDVLRSSHLKSPSRLSAETIVNLAENGVQTEVFVQLMSDGLKELFDGMTQWDGDNAMRTLWVNVARAGGVISQRRAREMGGEARVRGLGDRDKDDDDDADDDDDTMKIDRVAQPKSSAWWADEVSGCPSSLEETVMCLLESGFKPNELPMLADKLGRVLAKAIQTYVIRYKIDVPKSCHAFVIPGKLISSSCESGY